MKKKALISSILTIALCLSLIAGSTFALFTSTSDVNISVTAGKVDIVASVDQESLELYSMGVQQNDRFENGGTATFTDTASLKFDNITPGDKAVFDIVMTNNSTVAVQYRIAWSVNGELADALVATADGETLVSGTSAWTEWATPATDAEKTRTVAVSVELPKAIGNDYQEASAEISFNVVAVQGNGTDEYVPMCDIIATPETIDGILSSVAPNTVIGLAAGKYGNIKMTQDDLTLVSANAVVDFVDLNGKMNCTIDGLTFDAAGAQMTYQMKKENGQWVSIETGMYANVTGAVNSIIGAKNVQILNCSFIGTPIDESSFSPIALYERNRSSGSLKGLTVKCCTFNSNAAYYIYAAYLDVGQYTITNNTFGTPETNVGVGVYAGSLRGNIKISGNTFFNWEDCAFKSSVHGPSYKLTYTVKNNNFINTADSDTFSVVGFRNLATSNSTVVFESNIANYDLFTFTEPYDGEGENPWKFYDMSGTGRVIAFEGTTAELKSLLTKNDTTPIVIDCNGGEFEQLNSVGIKRDITIKNAVIEGSNGLREVYANNGSTVTLDNCTIIGNTYGIHIGGGDGNVVIKNCHIKGWNSFAASIQSVTIENCTFEKSGYACIRFYQNATITNCTFSDDFSWIDVSKDVTVTINNCSDLTGKLWNYGGTGTWIVDGVDISDTITSH